MKLCLRHKTISFSLKLFAKVLNFSSRMLHWLNEIILPSPLEHSGPIFNFITAKQKSLLSSQAMAHESQRNWKKNFV